MFRTSKQTNTYASSDAMKAAKNSHQNIQSKRWRHEIE